VLTTNFIDLSINFVEEFTFLGKVVKQRHPLILVYKTAQER